VKSEADWKRRGVLKMAMLDEPRYLIRLREPVVAHGLAGLKKTIDAIAVRPDGSAFILRADAGSPVTPR
jgi:hypothetical protein